MGSPPGQPNHFLSVFEYSCTYPLPSAGSGNISNEPSFLNPDIGDFRLAPGSPCIDAGTELRPLISADFDGNRRPLDGNGDGVAAFDMGAFEFGESTPCDAVDALLRHVRESELERHRKQPLIASLEAHVWVQIIIGIGIIATQSLRIDVLKDGTIRLKLRLHNAPMFPLDPDPDPNLYG